MLFEPQTLAPLALAAAGLVRRGREWRLAWLVAAAAATAILYPALVERRGVPSPSANLETRAPWQGAVATVAPAGNPELGDLTNQIEPWLLFLRSELRAGRLPFWNPHQSAGAPFWSNGQSAPLFPLSWLFALLPLELGFLLLPWLRVAIAASGTFLLARRLGAGEAGAALAAVVYPLGGRFTAFLLFPMGNALCLVPWIVLAVERLAAAGEEGIAGRALRRRWAALAALAGLQLVAGHPETAFFTAVVAGVYLVARGVAAPLAAWSRVVSAWIVGLLVSGAAIVPLLVTVLGSERWQEWSPPERLGLAVLGRLALRFFLPDAFGESSEGSYWGPFLDVPTSVYAGAVAIPLAVVAILGGERGTNLDRRLRALVVVVLAGLAASYQLPGAREILLALPFVQKMLHHYLLLGVELGLALLAGRGLDRLLAGGRRALVVARRAAAIPALAVAAAWLVFADDWSARGEIRAQALASLVAVGLPLLLLAIPARAGAARRRLGVLLVVVTAADLVAAHGRGNPGLPVERLYPSTASIDFLRGRPERLAALDSTLRPNAAMALGLYDVRGDDALKLSLYERIYGRELARPHPTYFQPIVRWQSPWLDRLGVRWVMAPPGATSPAPDWRVAHVGADATIFERPAALPLVRRESAAGADVAESGPPPDVRKRLPGRWEIDWPGGGSSSRLVVAETWDPGWRATLDGRPVAVERADGLFLGLSPGGAAGRVVLAYTPAGLGWGVAASGVGLFLLALALVRARSGESSPTRERGAPAAPGPAAS